MAGPLGDNPEVFLVLFIAVLFFSFLLLLIKRYKRCPSNNVLVVYGKVTGAQAAKTIHGGGTFVWPLIQDYDFLRWALEESQRRKPLNQLRRTIDRYWRRYASPQKAARKLARMFAG